MWIATIPREVIITITSVVIYARLCFRPAIPREEEGFLASCGLKERNSYGLDGAISSLEIANKQNQ